MPDQWALSVGFAAYYQLKPDVLCKKAPGAFIPPERWLFLIHNFIFLIFKKVF